jgi:hypothetical protein
MTSDSSAILSDTPDSLQTTERQFFFTILSLQLALQEIMPAPKTVGQIRNGQNSLQIVHGLLILCISILLFIHNSVNLVPNKDRTISVIAFSTGGHAPPSPQS